MLSKLKILLGLVLGTFLFLGLVSAKDKRRTSIDFEDELIEGDIKKPELLYLLRQKQFNYERLIKLRKNFLPEMRRTAEEIQQSGSGD